LLNFSNIKSYDLQGVKDILVIVWKSSKNHTICRLIIILFLAILPLLPLYILKLLLDHFAENNDNLNLNYLGILLIGFATVAVSKLILTNINQYVSSLQSDLIQDKMSDILISKAINLDFEYFDSDSYHDTFQRAINIGGKMPLAVFTSFISFLQNLITLIAIGSLLITLHWSIAIILFFIALPVAFIRHKYTEKTIELRIKQTQEERKAGYIKRVLTISEYAKEVRIFDYGKKLLSQFLTLRKRLRKEKRDLYKRQLIGVSFTQSAEAVAIIGALSIIIFKAAEGHTSVGDIALYYTAFQKGQSSINALLKSLVMIHDNKLNIDQIFEFLDLKNNNDLDESLLQKVPTIDSLALHNVSFTYPGTSEQVLTNINMNFERGKIYAFVGENGSGKTTLVKLINRLYKPQSGKILINNNLDINSFTLSSLREKISVIFQYFSKYNFSIKQNISLSNYNQKVDENKIIRAAQLSKANSFIQRFNEKLETKLGRSFRYGKELSGGQWQKIALARAFYKNADFLILDEPTSFIDPISEDEIFNNLREIGKDKILILITHRIYNLKAVDEIIVMDKGKIVESGNHNNLINKQGLYKRMFEKQDH
jgi:ATP-binding cassette subfamily B protein